MRTMDEYKALIDRALEVYLPKIEKRSPGAGEIPWLLNDAMRYSLLAGGKRLRPSMLLAAAEMLGGDAREALPMAAALEIIHTCSLVHDDLPGMDDDDLRRGAPTNHIIFGEGQAILAGDGLLNLAYELMLKNAMDYPIHATRHLAAIYEIAEATGARGMMGGQCMDLYCEREDIRDEALLGYIHAHKTGRLFVAPLRAAARLCGAKPEELDALTRFGEKFGLLFQAADDILDEVGDEAALGKAVKKDAECGKLTYVTLYGLEGARAQVRALRQEAAGALSAFGERAAFFMRLLDRVTEGVF